MASQLKIGITAQDEGFSAAMNNATKAASKTADVIDKVKTGSLNARQAYSQLNKATQQLALAYNAMSKEMQQSDIGQQLAAQLNAAKQQTAEMYDFMGDFRAEISNMASDTKSLDQMVGVFQGVNAVVQVGAGLMTQFGVAEDKVNKVQQTMLSLLNIANGLQTIQNLLQEQSVLTLMKKEVAIKINNVRQALNTSLTRKDTAAQTAWNVTKAVGKALLGDFTGLLLVGAAAYTTYALCASDATEELKEGNNELDKAKQKQDEFAQAVADSGAKSVASFVKLRNEWVNLRTQQERNDFIKKNRSEMEKYTGATNDLGKAFDDLVKKSADVTEALIAIAEAQAWGKKIEERVTKYIERDINLRKSFNKKPWKEGDIVTEADIKNMGLVEGVHYKKTGMGWNFKKFNTLTAAGMEKADKYEYYKSLNANRKAIKDNYDSMVEDTTYMANQMKAANARANKIFNNGKPNDTPSGSSSGRRTSSSRSNRNTSSGSTNNKNEVKDPVEEIYTVWKDTNNKMQQDLDVLKLSGQKNTSGYDEYYNKSITSLEQVKDLINKYIIKVADEKGIKEDIYHNVYNLLPDKIKEAIKGIASWEIDLTTDKGYNDILKAQDKYLTTKTKAKRDNEIGIISSDELSQIEKDATIEYYKELEDLKDTYADNKEVVNTLNSLLENYVDKIQKTNIRDSVVGIEQMSLQQRINKKVVEEPLKKFKSRYQYKSDEDALNLELEEKINSYEANLKKIADYSFKYRETTSKDEANTYKQRVLEINKELEQTQEEADAAFAKLQQLQTMDELFGGHTAIDIVAGSFGRLGDALMEIGGNGEIAKAGAVLAAIGQIILSFATASAQAAKLGPLGWIAFVTTGITTLGTVIGTLKRFESGGIVGGSSTMGDKQLVRVNSGEMILNSRQQSHLFNMLDNGLYTQNGTNVSITGKIKGSDIYLSQKNYGKTKALTGKNIGIK